MSDSDSLAEIKKRKIETPPKHKHSKKQKLKHKKSKRPSSSSPTSVPIGHSNSDPQGHSQSACQKEIPIKGSYQGSVAADGMLKTSNISIIQKYFSNLTARQIDQFSRLKDVYSEWNAKINVISRKDLDCFYERHCLHSLAIAKFVTFADGSRIMDLGCGGGFPVVPMAILFPNVQFLAVDSIGKKIRVVNAVKNILQISNLTALNGRVEQVNQQFDFVITRAVADLPQLVAWTQRSYSRTERNPIANGLIALKGGELSAELQGFPQVKVLNLSDWFEEDFFETKKLVYLPQP